VATHPDPVSVATTIDAPPARVYALVADLTRMGELSPERNGCTWTHGATGAAPGARFIGRNLRGRRRWSTYGTVVTAEPGVELTFDIHSVANLPVARWSYTIAPRAGGTACEVTETWEDRRGGVIKVLGGLTTGVWNRSDHNRAGMVTTLERLQRAAERPKPAGGPANDA
jgi:uncharacterized protein YndB with AHSA1/START domain